MLELRPAVRAGDWGLLSEKPELELITEGGLISPSWCMRGGGGGGSWGREYILSPVRFSSSFIWL